MTTEVWIELAKAVPNLVVFTVLVIVFMRGQRNLSTNFLTYMKHQDDELMELSARGSKVIEENSDIIRDNSKILGAVSVQLKGVL